jgi:hypothetical protein
MITFEALMFTGGLNTTAAGNKSGLALVIALGGLTHQMPDEVNSSLGQCLLS